MGYFQIEMTDLYGGEPNYSWVRRAHIREAAGRELNYRQIVRKLKAWAGWTGTRVPVASDGENIELRTGGIVVFCTWTEDSCQPKGENIA